MGLRAMLVSGAPLALLLQTCSTKIVEALRGRRASFISLLLLFYRMEDNYCANYFYGEVVGGVGVMGIFEA